MPYIQSFLFRSVIFFSFVSLLLGLSFVVYAEETDTDGDGIPDSWEDGGIDINDDGLIDFFPLGANPMRKDVFLEIDYMEGHFPGLDVVNNVRAAFENAPVSNPDGSTGITLHILIDEQIDHQTITSGPEFFQIRVNNFGTESERPDPAVPFIEKHTVEAKALVYHYAIFAHQYDVNPGSSGAFYELNTFVVTLGHPSWGDHLVTGHDVGSFDQRAGTLMHELGHSLGLNHGGGDGANCKPNYLSVMNYSMQFTSPIANRPLDYSRSQLNSLNEGFLSEPQGIQASSPQGLTTVHGPNFQYQTVTGNSIDWNQDGDTADIFLPSDINFLSGVGGCGNPTPDQILFGHDDWENLQYKTQLAQEAEGGRVSRFTGATDYQLKSKTRAAVRKFKKPAFKELTITDVIQMRLLSLGDLHRALQDLPDSFYKAFPDTVDTDYFVFGTDPYSSRLQQLIYNSKNTDAAIELKNMQADFDKRGKPESDQSENAVKQIVNKLANLQLMLEKSI